MKAPSISCWEVMLATVLYLAAHLLEKLLSQTKSVN